MPRRHYKSYKGITLLARNLRKNQTPSEKLLWAVLRRKSFFGYKFLRQHPIFYRVNNKWVEFFIADFYCSELKLILELDGKIHEDRYEYDSERDLKLLAKGIYVVRIQNEELDDMNSVILFLIEIISKRISQITGNKQNSPPSLIV
jgi:very-short-patch-repair endonuclease